MHKTNPAVYECKNNANGIHFWKRDPKTLRAVCDYCKLELSIEDTVDLYRDTSK